MFAHLFSHFRGHGVLVGGDGSREKRLEAIVRIFERSFNPRAAFSGWTRLCRAASKNMLRIGALNEA